MVIPPHIVFSSREIGLYWDFDRSRLIVPPGFWKEWIRKCKGKRYYIMPLLLTRPSSQNKGGHVGILIYDSNTKSLERFEPYGLATWHWGNPVNLDKKIKDVFNKNMGKGFVNKMYKPLDFSPPVSFQTKEEKAKTMAGDPWGFCVAWTIWYAEYRLSNPDLDRKVAVKYALDAIGKSPEDYKTFIRSYSAFVYEMSKELICCNDPSQHIKFARNWQADN
jgi:hypothetical protein